MKRYLVRCKHTIGNLKKNGVYIFNEGELDKVPERNYEAIDYDSLEQYTNQPNLLIIRSGGIGDLAILSILHDAAPRVIVVTQKKYAPYLNLWATTPAIRHFNEPIYTVRDSADFHASIAKYGILKGEDAIVEGSTEHWADIFMKAAGKEPNRRRPQFKPVQRQPKSGCLIVWQSGITDRTANPFTIAEVACNYFDSLVIGPPMTTHEYIRSLIDYEFVISTDTSAIHLREGFGLPGIAIFGAIHKDSRIDGYQYVRGIQSATCKPCYRHSMRPCQYNEGTMFAPCLADVSKELDNELKTIFESKNKSVHS